MDVRDLSFDSLRDTMGMVTQDGHLFHETIASNLRLARPDATEADMWDVLRRARLEPMIRSLPDGLETVVGGSAATGSPVVNANGSPSPAC